MPDDSPSGSLSPVRGGSAVAIPFLIINPSRTATQLCGSFFYTHFTMIQIIDLSLTEQQNAELNAEIQRVVNIAMAAQDAWGNWMNQSSGYHLVTNFYQDFHIAEMCGNAIEDIRDTYNRDFNEAKQNGVTFLAEFVMVLQTKCNVYYDGAQRAKNEGRDHTKYQQIHELYYNLYNEANDWCWDNLNAEDRNTYYQITD